MAGGSTGRSKARAASHKGLADGAGVPASGVSTVSNLPWVVVGPAVVVVEPDPTLGGTPI